MKDVAQMNSVPTPALPKRRSRVWKSAFIATLTIPTAAVLVWSWTSLPSTWAQTRDPRSIDQPRRLNSYPQPNNLPYQESRAQIASELSLSHQAYPNSDHQSQPGFNNQSKTTLRIDKQAQPAQEVDVPVTRRTMDKDGNISITTEYIRQRIPLQLTGRLMTTEDSKHNERIKQLVNQLRGSTSSNEMDAKLAEFRSELEQEFKRMHEQQGSEIAAIEKRLQSLKEIHQQRAENQDKIIQRRIDQLLGRSDPLDWNYTPPNTPFAPLSPYSSNQYGSSPISDNFHPKSPYAYPESNSPRSTRSWQPSPNRPPSPSPQKPASRPIPPSYPGKLMEAYESALKASDAAVLEQSNKERLNEYTRLHEEGALTASELRRATLDYASAQKQTALLKLQLQSIQRDLARYLNAAELELAALNEQQKTNPSANSKSAQLERQRAEAAITDAKTTLEQFEAAMKLIPVDTDSAEPSDAPKNPNESADQPESELDPTTNAPKASEDTTLNLETEEVETTPNEPVPSF
ncbi:MAG TPA: hypothetical protein DDX19_22275 [Rhodopirellula baltica]|uniref:Uncharacterized protein n=2 Tax=Rhodopirellula baltica TaxID=265606 RepID=Q7UFH0_RHOBA|nr:conserved hypothetical protein [Rhodopirellula baltica SH 1]HBE65428.1 hypothetical protein [Rhodopirellula baltica]